MLDASDVRAYSKLLVWAYVVYHDFCDRKQTSEGNFCWLYRYQEQFREIKVISLKDVVSCVTSEVSAQAASVHLLLREAMDYVV